MARTRTMSKRGRKMGRPFSSRNSTPAIEVGPQNTPANTPAPESLRAADSQSSLAERLEGIRSNRVSPSLRGGSEELGERPPQTDTSELPVNHDLTPNATPLVTVVEVAEHATASESTPHHSQSNDGSPANPRSPAPQEDHGWTEVRLGNDISLMEPTAPPIIRRRAYRRRAAPAASTGSSGSVGQVPILPRKPLHQYEKQLEELQRRNLASSGARLAVNRPGCVPAPAMAPAMEHSAGEMHTAMATEADMAPTVNMVPTAPVDTTTSAHLTVGAMPHALQRTWAQKAYKNINPYLHPDEKNTLRILKDFEDIGQMVWHDLQLHSGLDANVVASRYYNPRLVMMAVYMWTVNHHMFRYTDICTRLKLPPGLLTTWIRRYSEDRE